MADDSNKRKGFGRVIDAIVAGANGIEHTPYDYLLDRVCNLEREVLLLRDELSALRALDRAGGGRAKPASSSPAVAQ
jgi:hypothetical protein